MYSSASCRTLAFSISSSMTGTPAEAAEHSSGSLQDKPGQILVLQNRQQDALHVARLDDDLLFDALRGTERKLLEQCFHHGMQAPGPDVLRALIRGGSKLGDGVDRLGSERQRQPLRRHQRGILV